MIRETAVTALDGLVGFRQPLDSNYGVLDAGNLASSSGMYFEDSTGLVTVKNFVDTYEYDSPTSDQINTIMDNLRYSAAREVLNRIFDEESVNLESNTLFPYEEDFTETYTLTDDFYFIEIEPSNNKRVAFTIDYIWVSFNEAVTFNVYLYHSKKLSPIGTVAVTTVAHEATKVAANLVLDDTGTYRLGYKKADIGTAKPYKRDWENSSVPMNSRYACIEFESADFLANGRIDVDNTNSLEDAYGLNIEYSTMTDWTHEIVKNKNRFARALQLQMAITAADRIITSNRSNINQRLSREVLDRIAYTLGTEENGRGLKGQLRKELDAQKTFFFPKERIITSTLR